VTTSAPSVRAWQGGEAKAALERSGPSSDDNAARCVRSVR
jgi:hypothetical protein